MERNANFYMANLGSEFIRAFNAFEKKDEENCKLAVGRCFGIIEKVTSFPEMKTREGEMIILKDILEDLIGSPQKYFISKNQLESYFNPFSLRLALSFT